MWTCMDPMYKQKHQLMLDISHSVHQCYTFGKGKWILNQKQAFLQFLHLPFNYFSAEKGGGFKHF